MENPISRCQQWLKEALNHSEIPEPTAMCLSTASRHGAPASRMVLLKDLDDEGFVFYTNYGSRKSRHIEENQQVALNLFWAALKRQIRVEGFAEKVSAAESDAYFATRPRESQIGAWASYQSEPLQDVTVLEQRIAEITARFEGKEVPRPDFWGGWRVVPSRIEFWTEGAYRVHYRELFTRTNAGWEIATLYP